MVDEVQERRRSKAKITSQPDENDHLNQIKFLTQENKKLFLVLLKLKKFKFQKCAL